jgi:hypothetical protein
MWIVQMLTVVADSRCPFKGLQLQNSIFNLTIHKMMDLSILSIVHLDKNPWNEWLEAHLEATKIQNLLNLTSNTYQSANLKVG